MNIWKFVSGYVKIRIMGDYPERLVNRAAASGLQISGVSAVSEGSIVCRIPMNQMKRFRRCARGSGCRVRILSKHGVPLLLRRVRHETALLAACFAFIAALLFASSRLLMIEIESGGADEAEIAQALASQGVRVGIAKSAVSSSELSKSIETACGVDRAEVFLKGVKLIVRIKSSSGAEPGEYEGSYLEGASGIYALKDCVITSVHTVRGRALVKPGDAVTAGQLLITGDYSDIKPGYCVAAEGTVYGKVLYRTTGSSELSKIGLSRTGKERAAVSVSVFGRELLLGAPFEHFELTAESEGIVDACAVPVRLKWYRCFELSNMTVDIGLDAASRLAAACAQEKLFKLMPADAKLLSLKTEQLDPVGGSVTAVVTATAIENIGYGRN